MTLFRRLKSFDSTGYINHNTEIVIVKIPNEIKTRSAHRRRKSPPIVSHFLTEYELNSVKREKALVAVEMLDGMNVLR